MKFNGVDFFFPGLEILEIHAEVRVKKSLRIRFNEYGIFIFRLVHVIVIITFPFFLAHFLPKSAESFILKKFLRQKDVTHDLSVMNLVC